MNYEGARERRSGKVEWFWPLGEPPGLRIAARSYKYAVGTLFFFLLLLTTNTHTYPRTVLYVTLLAHTWCPHHPILGPHIADPGLA